MGKFKVGDKVQIPENPEWPAARGVILEDEGDGMYIVDITEIGPLPASWAPGTEFEANIEEIHEGAMEPDKE